MTESSEQQLDFPILLDGLQTMLRHYRRMLNQAADTIINENVSNYPVFVVTAQPIEVGLPLIERGDLLNTWQVNASTLEELVVKRIVESERTDAFIDMCRKSPEKICLFVISELGATFVMMPV